MQEALSLYLPDGAFCKASDSSECSSYYLLTYYLFKVTMPHSELPPAILLTSIVALHYTKDDLAHALAPCDPSPLRPGAFRTSYYVSL